MTTAPSPLQLESSLVRPPHFQWTRAKYERATSLGLLGPEDRVELVEGEIVRKMPQNSLLSTALTLAAAALTTIIPDGYFVRTQMPLTLDDLSQPEPDIAIVVGAPRNYKGAQPTARDAALIVEVSDTSLLFDQHEKRRLYARAGIPEYWIVNLPEGRLEVYREPATQTDYRDNASYLKADHFSGDKTITPLLAPNASIAASTLLP